MPPGQSNRSGGLLPGRSNLNADAGSEANLNVEGSRTLPVAEPASTSSIAVGGTRHPNLMDHDSSPNQPRSSSSPPPPSVTSSVSSRRRFLSRFSLPRPSFPRARNRNVADFHIRCDEPYKTYSAGEHVRGAVVLAVVKPIRLTHLVVSLQGFVRVHKDANAANKLQSSSALPQGDSSGRPRYHGSGLASLFQDEQVLSGEGRLEPGQYEFLFDLALPQAVLPSSIDFERGSISYIVTSTLTRPTTIAPTTTCDRKIVLAEKVDIGVLPAPRPRTIFLEPISKRTRRKRSAVLDKVSTTTLDPHDLGSDPESVAVSVATDDSTRERPTEQRAGAGANASDVQSEISAESGRSVNTATSRGDATHLSQSGTLSTSTTKHQHVVNNKTITATIELLKGGCLPGDIVSVRVSVQHIKRLKSMTGVIVTLFRQGKIDSSPLPTSFTELPANPTNSQLQKEEVYPKSKTRLGGLSLSSTSSTSMFRKDLDQNTAPLIIDPSSLHASVTISTKLPDDSFPTIKNVPGEMISFKYLVEVIVDLGGKLSNQTQGSPSTRLSNFGTGNAESSSSYGQRRTAPNISDTAQLRREKGVISVSMETVVGTLDSSRNRRSKPPPSTAIASQENQGGNEAIRPELGYPDETSNSETSPYVNGQPPNAGYFPTQTPVNHQYYMHPPLSGAPPPSVIPQPNHVSYLLPDRTNPVNHLPQNGYHYEAAPSYVPSPNTTPTSPTSRQYPGWHSSQMAPGRPDRAAPIYIPPPQMPDEGLMSDKDRIRQAEARLLPSQPPQAEASTSAQPDDDLYSADETTPRVPRLDALSFSGANLDDAEAGPSAPSIDYMNTPIATDDAFTELPVQSASTDDKQELERLRLIGEASAPPEFPSDMDRGDSPGEASAGNAASDEQPSAPLLLEEDQSTITEDTSHLPLQPESSGSVQSYPSSSGEHQPEQLPAYER